MNNKNSILYGIGVGPGDPDLITIKAIKAFNSVDVFFSASSSKNDFSLAVDIAGPHIPEGSTVNTLSFPMTKDDSILQKAWKENTDKIILELNKGKKVAFLTLGDPTTYSTFGYILRNIKIYSPDIPIEIIPGITSYQAASALTKRPLVEGEESLLITSAAFGGDNLRNLSGNAENIVLMKAYKNINDVTVALDEAQMIESSIAVSNCSRENEEIIEDITELKDRNPDYWTLILAGK